jgi:hypothetical protein
LHSAFRNPQSAIRNLQFSPQPPQLRLEEARAGLLDHSQSLGDRGQPRRDLPASPICLGQQGQLKRPAAARAGGRPDRRRPAQRHDPGLGLTLSCQKPAVEKGLPDAQQDILLAFADLRQRGQVFAGSLLIAP